jgi:uncharacterized membrane protein
MSQNIWIIIAAAIVTYLTRAGGFWILSRFERIHPRVEAGLNAVPAAVLTTLVAPQMAQGGVAELSAFAAAGIIGLRFGMIAGFMAGWATIIALRYFGV